MCLATAYTGREGNETVLTDIARIQFDGEHITMETLMGEEKVISGRVLEIDFARSKVILDYSGNSAAGNKPG